MASTRPPRHNALVALDGESYVELLDFSRAGLRPALGLVRRGPLRRLVQAGRPLYQRIFLDALARRSGPALFAFVVADLDRFVAASSGRGLVLADPVRMTRLRPDGGRVEWSLAISPCPELPFVVQDHTPAAARVPPRGAAPLDLVRVVRVGVGDLAATSTRYQGLFEIAPSIRRRGVATISVGGVTIEIVETARGEAPRFDC